MESRTHFRIQAALHKAKGTGENGIHVHASPWQAEEGTLEQRDLSPLCNSAQLNLTHLGGLFVFFIVCAALTGDMSFLCPWLAKVGLLHPLPGIYYLYVTMKFTSSCDLK